MCWAAGEERSLGQCAEASSCCPCRALRGALRIGWFPMPSAKEGGSLKILWKPDDAMFNYGLPHSDCRKLGSHAPFTRTLLADFVGMNL